MKGCTSQQRLLWRRNGRMPHSIPEQIPVTRGQNQLKGTSYSKLPNQNNTNTSTTPTNQRLQDFPFKLAQFAVTYICQCHFTNTPLMNECTFDSRIEIFQQLSPWYDQINVAVET